MVGLLFDMIHRVMRNLQKFIQLCIEIVFFFVEQIRLKLRIPFYMRQRPNRFTAGLWLWPGTGRPYDILLLFAFIKIHSFFRYFFFAL